MKNKRSITTIKVVLCLVVFCGIAVLLNIFSIGQLPTSFMGAALGAIITVAVTTILLESQSETQKELLEKKSDEEEVKERNVRVFEIKSEIFQEYIRNIWKVWEKQKITIEDFRQLTSSYYQDLMMYIKNPIRLKNIGNNLTDMGRLIGKNNYEDSLLLKNKIIEIINTLISEIDLGGEIDPSIMDKHDEIVFPLMFKNEILESLNNYLPTDSILEKGRYELFREGKWNNEHICFNFREYEGCKMIIGDFIEKKDVIYFVLVVDNKYHLKNGLRSDGIYCQRIEASNVHLSNPVNDKDFEEKDKEKAPPLNFSNNESMEKYRTNKRTFADVLANRAYYWFEKIKIEDLGIIDFLEKNIGKKVV
jgi:hypothetical protein